MVERLILTLRALSTAGEEPVGSEERYAGTLVRLAPDYADALLLVTDCPQVELSAVQRNALERVGEQLERMAVGGDVHTRANVAMLRAFAQQALQALGEPSPPDLFR